LGNSWPDQGDKSKLQIKFALIQRSDSFGGRLYL